MNDRLSKIVALVYFSGWTRGMIESAAQQGREIGPPAHMRSKLETLANELIEEYEMTEKAELQKALTIGQGVKR